MQSSNLVPDRIGEYQLETRLGEDRALEVWKARHAQLGTLAAVKFLNSQSAGNPELEERLFQEAERLMALNHPQIIAITDVLRNNQRVFVVTRYIDGTTLQDILGRGLLPLDEVVRISRDVLSALSFAHVKGVAHKDLTPWNIMVDHRGQAYVGGFGLSLAIPSGRFARAGAAAGGSDYMSPEQILRPNQVDFRSDIYSFGCILYEMLTGRTPFAGASEYEVMNAHVQRVPEPPSRTDGSIPRALQQIAFRALAKRPEDRFSSCLEMLDLLNRLDDDSKIPGWGVQASPRVSIPPAPVPPLMRKPRLSPWLLAAVVVVLAAAAVLISRSVRSKAPISSTDGTNGASQSAQDASIPPAAATSGNFAPIPPPPPVYSETSAAAPRPERVASVQPSTTPAPAATPSSPPPAAAAPATAPPPVAAPPAAATPAPSASSPPVTPVPASFSGMAFRARLASAASTGTSEEGDPFTAVVLAPAQFRNWILAGTVMASKKKNLIRRHAELAFSFQTLQNPKTGQKIPVTSSVTSYSNAKGEVGTDDDGNMVTERKNEPKSGGIVSSIEVKANSVSLKKGGTLELSVSTRAE